MERLARPSYAPDHEIGGSDASRRARNPRSGQDTARISAAQRSDPTERPEGRLSTLQREASTPRRTARPAGIVVAAVAALGVVGLALRSNTNGDVTYALGGLETAGKGGVSVWDIFIARPVAYKLLVAVLDAGRRLLVGDASLTTAHLVLRLETYVLVVLVTAVLFGGVRRVAGRPAAAGIAAATGLALVASPPWHFLEPDWVAPLCGVLAVGAALLPRRLWLGVLLGGLATMLVVAVKLAT